MTTETINQVITTTQVASPLDPVFNALVKAVADRIMAQVLESTELEDKITMVMDTVIEDKLDIDREIQHWMRNNFEISDYSPEIEDMFAVDEDQVKNIIRSMEFTVSAV